eukprot:3536129-Pyramimonas_sp.AAC.1
MASKFFVEVEGGRGLGGRPRSTPAGSFHIATRCTAATRAARQRGAGGAGRHLRQLQSMLARAIFAGSN